MKFFDAEGLSKRSISGIFILKVIFGLLLWAVYTFYYKDRATADIYKYFDDSKIMFDALYTHPWHYFKMLLGIGNSTPEFDKYYAEMHYWARTIDKGIYNDSHTIIRFNAFVRLFSLGYYNVHTVIICFLSLIGLTAIYKTFIPLLKDKKYELLFVVFLLPSVLFWGSGVLKEGLIFFALGILVYYSNKLVSAKNIFIFIASALLLALSKFYVWVSIFPGVIFLIWISRNYANVFLKFSIVTAIVLTLGLTIDEYTNIQNPLVTLSQKQIEFKQLASGNLTDANNKVIPVAGSTISIPDLEPNFYSFLKNSPQALLNTFFRPYVWELKSPMMLMAGLENVLLFLFILVCLLFMKPLSQISWGYVLFCFSFVMIQFLIIGETTPILGAIVRYKVPALPFLLIAFLFFLDKERLIKRLPILKNV